MFYAVVAGKFIVILRPTESWLVGRESKG